MCEIRLWEPGFVLKKQVNWNQIIRNVTRFNIGFDDIPTSNISTTVWTLKFVLYKTYLKYFGRNFTQCHEEARLMKY